MLPAMTNSPPNFFTPKRRPALSRPLREEPPAFLWAMTGPLLVLCAGADVGDAQHGERLAMPVLAAIVVPAPLLEDEHLLALDLTHHFGGDGGTRGRHAGVGAVADHENIGERHAGAGLAGQPLDGDDVVFRDFVLFAAGADDCEHG